MIPVVSRAQARAFDEAAIARGVPGPLLMENAGRGVVDVLLGRFPAARTGRVVVVCGPGNNGGDGFVVARHLVVRGAHVDVFVTAPIAKIAGDARGALDAMCGVGVVPREVDHELLPLREACAAAVVIVDAVFGTGLSRPVDGAVAAILEAVQEARRPILAVDIPSGLDADTGAPLGAVLHADLTVTFGAQKLGLLTPSGAVLGGEVIVADIGVPGPSLDGGDAVSARLLERVDVTGVLTPRARATHKNGAGHVVVFAGSPGHIGAAMMCAHGALRAGAGLVTIASWPEAAAELDGRTVEVMTARLSPETLASDVDAALRRATAVVLGPGFGKDERARAVVRQVLRVWAGPSVVDADALGMFPGEADVFASSLGAAVLTPHPGELGVLLGSSAKEIEADRYGALAECVSRARSVSVLKGAYTLIGAPDESPVINGSGTSVLATAGSGDVLAGTIAALACSLDPFEAAFVGVHLHGLAAEAWSRDRGGADRGLLAHEIADLYPAVIADLLAGQHARAGGFAR